MANANSSDTLLRTVLGPTLQGGALRAVGILAGFSAVGAFFAYLLV